MTELPFQDEEEVLVLSTRQPWPRWLLLFLKILALLLVLALLIAGGMAWRYYAVQRQVKKDLAIFIGHEEELRALGGVDAVDELVPPDVSRPWRFRYQSSIRARRGRAIPDLVLKRVTYHDRTARVHLEVDGLEQQRQYRLEDARWYRVPFEATNWGEKQESQLPQGVTLVSWQEDADFAQVLSQDLPDLLGMLQALGLPLSRSAHRVVIIPKEFGSLARPGEKVQALIINSPHVDWIPQAPGELSYEQELRLALAQLLFSQARDESGATPSLPGATRVQTAIHHLLAWQWAVGEVNDAAVLTWARKLKGHWVSPVTGLPPDLITELQPEAPDVAARLMMTYLLRREGVDALVALHEAMRHATTWDEAYAQAVGQTAFQVEEATRQMLQDPTGPLPPWPAPASQPPPQMVTYLGLAGDEHTLIARAPQGEALLLHLPPDGAMTLADGSHLETSCVASGSQLRLAGRWLDQGLRVEVTGLILERAVLPLSVQTPALDPQAQALIMHMRPMKPGQQAQARLMQLMPGGIEKTLVSLDTTLVVADPTGPLLAWMSSSTCDRPWILVYQPEEGVVGAWLAPTGVQRLLRAWHIGDHFFFQVVQQEQGALIYRSGPEHRLERMPEETRLQVLEKAPVIQRWQPLQGRSDAFVVEDPFIHETRILYHARQDEQVGMSLLGLGGPETRFYFLLRRSEGKSWVAAVDWDHPDEVQLLFPILTGETLAPVFALCPGQAYLYAHRGTKAQPTIESYLRLHRAQKRDQLLLSVDDQVLVPLYCRIQGP